jgi:hypothetical protein
MMFACVLANAQPDRLPTTPQLLRDARLAVRLANGAILIRGSYGKDGIEPKDGIHVEPQGKDDPYLMRVTAAQLASLRTEETPNWKRGDRWLLYPGSAPPVPVVIDAIVLESTGPGPWIVAMAQPVSPSIARQIHDFPAQHYLATPEQRPMAVSTGALLPVPASSEIGRKVERELLAKARAIVAAPTWKKSHVPESEDLDKKFLGPGPLKDVMQLVRWTLPGRQPVLFVQVRWEGLDGEPLFALSAAFEESHVPRLLDFDADLGERMRYGSESTVPTDEPTFVNAWSIGGRRFVLLFGRGYENYAYVVMELTRGKGLVPTALSFGDGA